ncbi:tyrosine-type recombinase/integrase [Halodesulfovibrio sp.]|jgi:integrase|uniref:tyrosine-type recombinase/integrase n=1 Tax=Halodesulfovibrio sp. TaxID=1912772 RepID=UPI0025EA80F0|nr:tyrosine-type recombinase/integrase [Halodesulfovibrio sp.]MCT4535181.1 tyrosine-type recombinase/integrase [Halodesulfovibrio sp.]
MAFQMKNGKWKGQVYYTDRNGKVHRKTKNFDRKRDALQWQTEERKKLELADQEAETKQKNFKELKVGEWAELYMEYAFNTFTEENCKLAKEKQRAFKRFFETKVISPEVQVSSVRKKDILDVFNILKQHYSGKNVDRQIKNLKASWNWGIDYLEMPEVNPFCRLPKAATTEEEPHYMPPLENMLKVLKLAAKSDEPQHYLVLFTLLMTAARRVEMRRLTWADVKFMGEQIGLRTRKRKDRIESCDLIPLATELAAKLKEYKLQVGGKRAHVFSGIQLESGLHMRWLKRLCVKAKVTPFGVHGIRALAGTLAHTNGACLMDVKELLRHKSTHQTDRYLRKQYRKNEAVGILSSITSKAENNGQHSEEKSDASAA